MRDLPGFHFTLDWTPATWKRVSTAKSGRSFKPKATRNQQKAAADACKVAMHQQGVKKLEGVPVSLGVVVYIKTTAWVPGSGDLDNYEKLIQDALNGVAYDDDCQITRKYSYKKNGTPYRTEIYISQDVEFD